jgi:NAD(P)H-flavin reductase
MDLYWGVRRPEDAYHQALLNKWREKYEHFNYTIVLSEPEHFPTWDGKTGLVHEYVAKIHPLFKEECVFASGPYPMIMAAHSLFRQQGLAPDKFICDMLENY